MKVRLLHASFRREAVLVLAAAGGMVLLVSEAAKLLKLDLKADVAPAITAAGVVAAVGLFILKEASDRRRKTLEAFERQLYDRDLRGAISTVTTAVRLHTYEPDDEPDRPGSHRDLTSFIINYVEVSCEGAERGLYDRAMMRDLLLPLAQLLISNFLVKRPDMPSERFLKLAPGLSNMEATFSAEFEEVRASAKTGPPTSQGRGH